MDVTEGYNGSNSSVFYIDVSQLLYLPERNRRIFFWLILFLTMLALLANVAAIITVKTRTLKSLQKACIISLAVADISAVVMYSTNHLETLSKPAKTWTLGHFMCSFTPLWQLVSTMASSLSIFFIALDRYRYIVAIGKKWDPSASHCIFLIVIIWLTSTALCYPMSTFFSYFPILVKYDDDHYEDTHLCLATQQQKSKLAIYTISLIVVVFLPVILIFVWFYYNIALMLWRHRKKFQETTNGGNNIVTESNIASANKKLKSFVVIIVLTVAFVSFRLPSYIFNIVIMSNVYETYFVWNMVFSLNCLMIVNCILNPLLYTFLNQTVNILHRLQGVMVKILLWCCCFTNTDIDELESYSPFYCDNHSESQRTNTGTSKKIIIKTAQETTSSPLVIGKVTPLERY